MDLLHGGPRDPLGECVLSSPVTRRCAWSEVSLPSMAIPSTRQYREHSTLSKATTPTWPFCLLMLVDKDKKGGWATLGVFISEQAFAATNPDKKKPLPTQPQGKAPGASPWCTAAEAGQ